MIVEIKIPSVGESVTEAVLAEWFKQDGDAVERDEPLFVIETDKVTLEVVAEAAGRLKVLVQAGDTVAIGTVVGTIDTAASRTKAEAEPAESGPDPGPREPRPSSDAEAPRPRPQAEPPEPRPGPTAPDSEPAADAAPPPDIVLPPSVRRLVAEKRIDVAKLTGTGPGGRITKLDVLLHLDQAPSGMPDAPPSPKGGPDREAESITRKPMSPIRRRIADRLLEARRTTAMLTTFNEIDMSRTMALRGAYKEAFAERHGVGLGFMSFFVKASVQALREVPEINAFIDGTDIVYHDDQHIGVAVGTPKGLVVPVIRHAERLGFAQIEQAIVDYAAKIENNRLELADLEGGTFTISNGGVFGSLLSTPILNTPQSGILGMHKIEKRPVVVDDQIVIRPMMYVALSYDHRIVDGKGAVTCLKRIKALIENPERMMLEI